MSFWNSIPFLMKLLIASLLLGTFNYLIIRKKGYTSITYLILGIGVMFTLLYQISKLL